MLPIPYEFNQDILKFNIFKEETNLQMIINTSTQEETMGAIFLISQN